MRTRLIKIRFRRQVRNAQKHAVELGTQAEKGIEKHLLKRFGNLLPVRRFVLGWVGLLALLVSAVLAQNIALGGYYQTLQTVPGGIYNEGVLGRFTNANPIYATQDADTTVSRLIFAGLMTYDTKGKLVGDLASGYEVDAAGSTYTVKLKPKLTWQDGQPLTSEDVLFTFKTIQNPDVQSPLQAGWQGVEITAPDPSTVVFKLPGVLAAFPYSLTTGILPKHLLASVPPADMRSSDFNTVKPVGAGPFMFQAVEVSGNANPRFAQQQIALNPFGGYNSGPPKLQRFVVRVFADKGQLIDAFKEDQLTGVEGLTEVPDDIRDNDSFLQHNLPLRATNMVFFKMTSGVLAEEPVRQALVRGADTMDIIKDLGYPARPVRQPVLSSQIGFDPALSQPQYDLKAAKKILDDAGWRESKNGTRAKDGKELSFSLTTANTRDYRMVTKKLKKQWKELGVDLKTQVLTPADFQTVLTSHGYEAVLYGISIGPDPDVFVYWDSSQADIRSQNRLNLSEYQNPDADAALEAGRTRLDPNLRAIKYRPFLEAWQRQAPALGLYQPRLLYMTNGNVSGLEEHAVNTAADRLNNVHNWQIREARVTN